MVDRGIKGVLVSAGGCLLDYVRGSLDTGKRGAGSFGGGSCQGGVGKPVGGPQGVFERGFGKVEGERNG